MTARSAILVTAVLALAACTSSEDREIKDFLARQDSHWTEIKSDVDTPGPDRPSGWQGANKEGYYSGGTYGQRPARHEPV